MKNRNVLLLLVFFFYLILCPQTAICSAREGLLLWYRSLLPSLLPFMLLCSLFLRTGLLDRWISVIYKPFHKLTGCSPYGAFALLTGFFCGFPMGAKITSDLKKQQKISPSEADWLMGFVNNLSPVFLLSYVACDQLKLPRLKYGITVTVLGSAFLYGILTSLFLRKKQRSFTVCAYKKSKEEEHRFFPVLDACMDDTLKNMLRLGVYMMLFCMIRDGVQIILPSGRLISRLFCASMEITGGVHLIAGSSLPFYHKYVLLNALCAFGGFCALAQSVSIAEMDSDTLLKYIKSRVLITLLCICLSGISVLFFVFVSRSCCIA